MSDLAGRLRQLRRRQARRRGDAELSYRALAARTGWSHTVIGDYFNGRSLPPVDRFDVLVQMLGATAAELGPLATARDQVEERRRRARSPARPAPDWPPDPGPPAGAPAVPHQLPGTVAAFTGREDHLARLDAILTADTDASAVPVVALCGTAGVGKTALAIRWAHRVAQRFADGQLYVDLRGYDPGQPMSRRAALTQLLRGLDVAAADVPADVDEAAARLRTTLAGRRMLLVLDNARSSDQVRPLLPGTASCLVLTTSRDDLAGLVARDGAQRLMVDPLPPADSVALLHTLIGRRVEDDPAAATHLAEHCGRLPLALRVAAEVAARRSTSTLADLLEEGQRLDLLDHGTDPRSRVRTVLSWSYRQLPADAAAAFVLLGTSPYPDLDAHAVAALTGTADVAAVRRLLHLLTEANLAEELRPGRFGLHDLLRAYAAEQAETGLTPERRRVALTGLLDHFLAAGAAATGTQPQLRLSCEPRSFGGPGERHLWLDREEQTLLALSGYAVDHGWPDHAVALSQILCEHLDLAGNPAALVIHANALRAAADGPAAADAAAALGRAYWRAGRQPEAAEQLTRALADYRRLGDQPGAARVLRNLAAVEQRLARHPQAFACLEEALRLSRSSGDRLGEGRGMANLAVMLWLSGRPEESLASASAGLAIARELGDRQLVATAANVVGMAHERLGHPETALSAYLGALTAHRETGNRPGEAAALLNAAFAYRLLGRLPEALDAAASGLALGLQMNEHTVHVEALNTLGEILHAAGRAEESAARHDEALALALLWGDKHEEARAHEGLAGISDDTDDPGSARAHRLAALAIYADLGMPEAEGVRARLGDPTEPTVDPVTATQ